MKTCIMGIDPGFKSCGIAIVSVASTREEDRVLAMYLIETDKSDAKRKVYAVDDNYRRLKEYTVALRALVQKWNPWMIGAEAMSFPRSASAAAKVAMTWGVLASLEVERQLPLLQLSPQQIKTDIANSKSASKEEVQAALRAKFAPALLIPRRWGTEKAVPAGKLEHPFDALAAAVACLNSEQVALTRRLL